VNGVTQCDVRFSFSGSKRRCCGISRDMDGCEREARGGRWRRGAANPAMRPAEALRELPEVFDAQTLDLIASFQQRWWGPDAADVCARRLWGRGGLWCRRVSANSELRRSLRKRRRGADFRGVSDDGDVDRQRGDDCGGRLGEVLRGELPRRGWWLRRS